MVAMSLLVFLDQLEFNYRELKLNLMGRNPGSVTNVLKSVYLLQGLRLKIDHQVREWILNPYKRIEQLV